MSEWKEYRLGNLTEITSSKRIFYSDYVSEGIPFYRSKEIIEMALGESKGESIFISKKKYFDIKEKFGAPDKGDLLISAVGERAGIPFIVKNQGDFYFKDGNLIWLRNIKKGLNPIYIYYWLKSNIGQQTLENIMIGSAQKALTIIGLKQLVVPLPSQFTQGVIAFILSSLDDKIDLLHRQNKTLEQLAETLFRQWFVEEVEESWKEVSLSDIAIHFKQNIIPLKSPETIFQHYSLPNFDDNKEPKNEIGKNILSGKYQVVSNSILISKLNPRTPRIWGLFGTIDEENAVCSTEFQVVKPKDNKWYGFIYCFLKSYQVIQELTGASSGTSGSHQRVNPQDIFNLTFQKPTNKLIEQFNDKTIHLFQKIKSNTKQIHTLTQLRDTLLPKLMSGEMRVT